MTFAEWLQQRLDEHGWNIAELQRRSGVPYATVYAYVRGTRGAARAPQRGHLSALAVALSVPEGQVFDAAGLADPNKSDDERVSLRWAALGRSLTPEQERTAWAMLQAFRRSTQ